MHGWLLVCVVLSVIYLLLRAIHYTWIYPHSLRCLSPNCYFEVRGAKPSHVTQAMNNHNALHDLDWGD